MGARVSTAAVQERVRDHVARGAPARIVARSGWLGAGRPVRDAAPISLADDHTIVEYVAGDLTLTARAGASLASIAAATGAEGQWLALDPFGAADGTLGATVATGSAGPLAHAFGTPRDAVLGLEVVTGAGEMVRAGGRVVKNVAGFDLARLFTGAWGTLAVITEVTVRLRARPERDETVALPIPDAEALAQWLARLRALPFSPLALEMVSESLAARLGLDGGALLLARLGGNENAVRAQRQLLGSFGDLRDANTAVWDTLRAIEPSNAAVARVSTSPSRLHAIWVALSRTNDHTLAHATVGRGVVRTVYCHDASEPGGVDAWLASIAACEGTHIFERLPAPSWRTIPCRVDDRISRAVRNAFDPAHILNRGILGEVA
jgi:glycolate oxidase FAD binding subunit